MGEETPGVCETVPVPHVVFHVQHIRNGEVIDEFDVDATVSEQPPEDQR